MNLERHPLFSIIEKTLPLLILLIMLFYTYAKFLGHPYGMRWESSTGVIIHVLDKQPEPTLKEGDQIIQIGNITWEEFNSDLRKTFFVGVNPREVVPIIVERNGQIMHIDWVFPRGPTRNEFLDQLISEWFIAYFFWLAGLLTILFIRPKDNRWLLMALFNFLTAVWLIAGSGASAFHTWNSALVLRVAVLLCVPVYLHLHWLFPQPLGKLSTRFLISVYGVTLALVIAQWFQILSNRFFALGFTIALGGSFILLLIHLLRQPSARRDIRLLFIAVLLAMAMAVIWQIIYSLDKIPKWLGSAGLLGLPLIPLAYLYSAFRRRLGDSELRVNRFFSIYLFVILLGMVELPIIVLLDQFVQVLGEVSAISLITAVLTAVAFIWGYPAFESFIEYRIFGIPLPSKRLLEVYSARITTSDLLPDLVRVLETEIIPSLLIRQFVFLQSNSGTLKVLSKLGVDEAQIPKEQDMPALLTQPGLYRSPDLADIDQPYSWIRLVLPLKLGDETNGFWLFGRRDPDDIYSQLEIPILQSLASQTAIALSNILQTERLKNLYEANIDRYEQERLRLAHDLHDSVMNEMAALMMREDAPVFSPEFQQAFEALTERLREIVTDLRPPALTFGLKLALEDLAEALSERNRDKVRIVADIYADAEWHYPDKVENHLYRIVQEACGNALKYAHAKNIRIAARLFREKIEIIVDDDGGGFKIEARPSLDNTHASKHYGLTGMHERASLIGARVDIDAKSGMGALIQVTWKSKEPI